ncbi:hypothetical protein [Candidatus Leptofilum sp.]|uniref:hypothetical protein n=1 Tax=Candidatus Leptofilum sp. TaxID=3241576 RepID=UPI003B593BA8
MNQLVNTFLLITVLTLLIGCSDTQSTTGPQLFVTAPPLQESEQTIASAYPGPSSANAYPGPDSEAQPNQNEFSRLETGFEPDEPVPTPSLGLTTVTGYVFSKESQTPVINIPVVLAQIYRNDQNDGSFVYNTATSPYALTDVNGRFIFSNVDPAEFVIVVGDIEVNYYEIITDSGGGFQIINLPMDEILDLGVIEVGLE